MILGIMGVFSAQLAAKPEREQTTGLLERANGDRNGCNVQRWRVSNNFVTSNCLWYKYVIDFQKTVFVCFLCNFVGFTFLTSTVRTGERKEKRVFFPLHLEWCFFLVTFQKWQAVSDQLIYFQQLL